MKASVAHIVTANAAREAKRLIMELVMGVVVDEAAKRQTDDHEGNRQQE